METGNCARVLGFTPIMPTGKEDWPTEEKDDGPVQTRIVPSVSEGTTRSSRYSKSKRHEGRRAGFAVTLRVLGKEGSFIVWSPILLLKGGESNISAMFGAGACAACTGSCTPYAVQTLGEEKLSVRTNHARACSGRLGGERRFACRNGFVPGRYRSRLAVTLWASPNPDQLSQIRAPSWASKSGL